MIEGQTTRTNGPSVRVRWGLAAAALLAVAACDSGEPVVRAIEKTRDVELLAPSGGHVGHGSSGGLFEAAPATAPAFRWETPPGWIERPTSSMRQANFLVAGDERAECYLTVLPGDAGGLAANVARWRSQMSLPPEPADAVEALATAEFFGAEAPLVDFTGPWKGMSGEELPDHRLVGLLLVTPAGSKFLKMVGPSDVVGAELDAFFALARSFGVAEPEPAAASGGGSGLTWSTPDGWRRAPDRTMRLVTFHMGADESAECYVTVLGGDAGGVLANINRWRGQVGLGGIGPHELADLERLPMLGGDAVVVDVAGSYRGMSGEAVADARMLGAIRTLPGQVLFVKMIGPRSTLDAEGQAFRDFCSSLEIAAAR